MNDLKLNIPDAILSSMQLYLSIDPFLVGLNDAEGIFFTLFNPTTFNEVRT